MKLRPLMIGPVEQAQIDNAVKLARAKPVPLSVMQEIGMPKTSYVKLEDRPPGWQRGLVSEQVILPVGYRCAVSFEQQEPGLFIHLSVSVDERGKLPNIPAVEMICKAYRMKFAPGESQVWIEEFDVGWEAVNVLEPAPPAPPAPTRAP